MDELIGFITARLDEDEAAAKAAAAASKYGGRANWSARYGTIITDEEDPDYAIGDLSMFVDEDAGVHIARHDPARVLREVAAKRAILAEYEADAAIMHSPDYYAGLEFAIRALADVWSGHPDY